MNYTKNTLGIIFCFIYMKQSETILMPKNAKKCQKNIEKNVTLFVANKVIGQNIQLH